ncbi:type II secretion system protein [Duganella sp. BJB488]|uniref:type II secretion system protein n=1 Tax=unclassified Duganella TaxID=2636909 RepID=UPI000E34CD14|nr:MULTISPECIES: type II secretion system protein [unclassified Duganella]RFP12357.1 type II secretion system protein [Duganella sp. BJB489]RFP16549.1 type II secretion system protein [Duganella sp. BJB488]RFP30721.1 type II secretion system protein [Duganella sp. BJB480]
MRAQRLRRVGGFTYLSLLILLAIIGLVTATALKLGSVVQRSRAEMELLDIGAAFSDALKSYADATPAGMPPQPPSLKELLKDPRFPGTRRHLRKLFVDPMTGKAEWGILYLGDKVGVLAVYSLSDAKPVKVGNFPARYTGFEGKAHISDWKFSMALAGAVPTEMTGPSPRVTAPAPGKQQAAPPSIPPPPPPPVEAPASPPEPPEVRPDPAEPPVPETHEKPQE